jgi:hypothetical protein
LEGEWLEVRERERKNEREREVLSDVAGEIDRREGPEWQWWKEEAIF